MSHKELEPVAYRIKQQRKRLGMDAFNTTGVRADAVQARSRGQEVENLVSVQDVLDWLDRIEDQESFETRGGYVNVMKSPETRLLINKLRERLEDLQSNSQEEE